MKRTYVETNFLVDLLRPFPSQEARNLYARHGQDLELAIPWCCFKEVERTLMERVIAEDVGFSAQAKAVWADLRQTDPNKWNAHGRSVQRFLKEVRNRHQEARANCQQAIQQVMQSVVVLPLSQRATERALEFSRLKLLKPFDEMIMGCVLADAEAHTGMKYFCNLNTGDFMPTSGNNLDDTYQAGGITYLKDFSVP